MIRFRTIAQAMQARLEEIPALTGKVVVYRRSDIESEFNRRMNKTRGKAVVIRILSARNMKEGKVSFFAGKFSVTLFTVPTLTQKDAEDADDLMTAIEAKLQGWWPDGVASNKAMWLQCEGVEYPDDDAFDITRLTVSAPGNLK
jgi:hypothetical protein